jgi:beta-lactamase regulating signal transducer with metallopeptidase domain
METLLRIGLSNAVVALVMALVVVTVACLWRRPAVLHALWLLVLVKLVTPPLIWVRVPWPIFPETPAVAVAPTVEPAPIEPLVEENTAYVPDSEGMRETASAEVSNEPAVSETLPDALTPLESLAIPNTQNTTPVLVPGWMAATCGLWLAGALAWYALALLRLRRFSRMLRHAIPAPESLRQRTQRLAERLRLRRCPGVWLVPGRVAPMLWAAGGRPRILFPADLLKQVGVEQQNALLVHELAHLRRRDHWVRWLEFAAAGLYWWNPVLWFARRELREAEEQCCDAWVTSTLPGAGKTYATALLETLDFLSDAPPATPLLASGVGRVVDLKRRLTMIMRGTTPRTLGWRGAAAVIGLGALLLPMLPAWVQAQPAPKTEAKDVKKADVEVFKYSTVSPEDLQKARAELQALEAVFEQRKAELAETAARVEAARARVRRDESAAKGAAGDGASNGRIEVMVDGAPNLVKVEDILKQIQAVRPGPAREVIVIDRASGKIIMKVAGGNAVGADLPPPDGRRWVVQGDTAFLTSQAPPAVADSDKRIIDLEMKLKSILNEVEQLRQERRPAAPKPADIESKPQSYGSTPLEKIPVIDQLFKSVGSTQMLRENAAMQEKLRVDAERLKAESAALAAERDGMQVKWKLMEEEIAKLKHSQQQANHPTKP